MNSVDLGPSLQNKPLLEERPARDAGADRGWVRCCLVLSSQGRLLSVIGGLSFADGYEDSVADHEELSHAGDADLHLRFAGFEQSLFELAYLGVEPSCHA